MFEIRRQTNIVRLVFSIRSHMSIRYIHVFRLYSLHQYGLISLLSVNC